MANNLIEFRNITKEYVIGEVPIVALNEVNFIIDEGSLLSFLVQVVPVKVRY